MPTVVMIDGRLVPSKDARVSVFDRGFLYGDSVFETIRTYGGRPFALDEHLARLERSAQLVHIRLPVSADELRREIATALDSAGNLESYVRVMITRGETTLGLVPQPAVSPLRVVIVSELQALPAELYERGASAVTYRTQRPSDATDAAGAKIGNYLISVLAMRVAHEHHANEALILDRAGLVVEGATSNLFFVEDGELVTPPEGAGILAGVTRAKVLALAQALGLVVRYEVPTLSRLMAAPEVFITSSIRELLPIVRIDGHSIGTGEVGPFTRRILDGFRQLVRGAWNP